MENCMGRTLIRSRLNKFNSKRFIVDVYFDIQASCMRGGTLFQDDHFPPVARSLYYSRDPSGVSSYVTWLRPSEICEEPELFVDGADRHDINQVVEEEEEE